MGLIKFIILVVLIFAALAFWRQLKAWQSKAPSPPPAGSPLLMVRCAKCDLHLPQNQAVSDGSKWYCCQAHRDEAPHG